MHLISYKLIHDDTFAPNPYFGILTLATCKPKIRNSKNVRPGDWIAGWTSVGLKENSTRVGQEKLIYLAKISRKIPISQYWFEYPQKRPVSTNMNAPEYYGDNIYEPDENSPFGFKKVDSKLHCKVGDLEKDTGGKNVLICNEFYYFSAVGALEIPKKMKCDFNQVGRGHKIFSDGIKIKAFIDFVKSKKDLCKFSGKE